MHPVVNHLIQLQELALIRDEQKVVPGAAHLEELDASIKTMTGQLPKAIGVLYDKLYRKDHVVIVPVAGGSCAVCGMKLPISLVQSVRVAKDIHGCPNCARMLYYPEEVPKRVGTRTRRTAPSSMA